MPASSALSGALARVGDRWSLLLVESLLDGPRRFAELQASVPGIATNVLAQRLRRLEADGVVMARPYSRRPVRYSYALTEAGLDLAGAARLLAQWSADHGGGEADPPTHQSCGSPLVARWWCPTCDQPADAEPSDLVWI
jgi:DNA-binding HxlR family transcriptional regulator